MPLCTQKRDQRETNQGEASAALSLNPTRNPKQPSKNSGEKAIKFMAWFTTQTPADEGMDRLKEEEMGT